MESWKYQKKVLTRNSRSAFSYLLHIRRNALDLLIFRFAYKELIGSALPAIEGDELDVTLPQVLKQPEHTEPEPTPPTDGLGLSVMQKLVVFGIIAGAVAFFIRTRKTSIAGEKSLA